MIETIKNFFIGLVNFDHWSDYAIIIGVPVFLLLCLICVCIHKKRKHKKHLKETEAIKTEIEAKIHAVGVKLDATKGALQAILRNDIICLYEKCKAKRKVTHDERTNFENMYTQYKYLGVCPSLDAIYSAFMALPGASDVPASTTVEKSSTLIY